MFQGKSWSKKPAAAHAIGSIIDAAQEDDMDAWVELSSLLDEITLGVVGVVEAVEMHYGETMSAFFKKTILNEKLFSPEINGIRDSYMSLTSKLIQALALVLEQRDSFSLDCIWHPKLPTQPFLFQRIDLLCPFLAKVYLKTPLLQIFTSMLWVVSFAHFSLVWLDVLSSQWLISSWFLVGLILPTLLIGSCLKKNICSRLCKTFLVYQLWYFAALLTGAFLTLWSCGESSQSRLY